MTQALSSNILAIDVGTRRMGVAIASLEARLAHPLVTIEAEDEHTFIVKLKELIDEHEVGTVVVGLPRGMDGQETNQTRLTREFARRLKDEAKVKIYLQDEAGTSLQAEEELQDKNQPYTKGDIDKLAAALILHDWLAGATVEEL